MSKEQRAVKIFAIVLAVMICLSIFSAAIGLLRGLIFFIEPEDDYRGTPIVESIDGRNVNRLSIDLGSINLELLKGTEFRIEKDNINNKVNIRENNGTIKVEERSHGFWNIKHGGTLRIYIPKDLDKLDIDMGAGALTIEDIKADNLDLDQGAGTIHISDSYFDSSDIDGGMGKMTIKNSTLKDLDLDSGVGAVDIEAYILGKSEIDGGVGSINLDILGFKDDYTLSIEKGLGSVSVDGESLTGRTGSGPNYLKVDSGVGSIKIDFNKN